MKFILIYIQMVIHLGIQVSRKVRSWHCSSAPHFPKAARARHFVALLFKVPLDVLQRNCAATPLATVPFISIGHRLQVIIIDLIIKY
jgi:hypothetical protein